VDDAQIGQVILKAVQFQLVFSAGVFHRLVQGENLLAQPRTQLQNDPGLSLNGDTPGEKEQKLDKIFHIYLKINNLK
jgi:hypothetical protein